MLLGRAPHALAADRRIDSFNVPIGTPAHLGHAPEPSVPTQENSRSAIDFGSKTDDTAPKSYPETSLTDLRALIHLCVQALLQEPAHEPSTPRYQPHLCL